MPGTFFKEPYEQFTVGMDFALALPSGATIASGTCSAQDIADGTDQTTTILVSSTATIVTTIAKVTLKAGTAGHLYNLRFRVTLNTGELLEEDATLSVQEEGP